MFEPRLAQSLSFHLVAVHYLLGEAIPTEGCARALPLMIQSIRPSFKAEIRANFQNIPATTLYSDVVVSKAVILDS